MARRNTLQPRPPLQTRVEEELHPSLGTGNPYSQDMRALGMFMSQQELQNDPNVANLVDLLRTNHMYPSAITQWRYEQLEQNHGHVLPCRRTGNRHPEKMPGQDLIYLALYRVAYPKCSIAEMNSFLYRANLGNPTFSFYLQSQISLAEKSIGLTRKKGSTTAYQALLPRNVLRRFQYWNLPFPVGIADVRREMIIDLDECGIFKERHADRKHGKAFSAVRVREEGQYGHGEKWNVLLAISGEDAVDGNDSRRWLDVWLNGGTTVNRMLNMVRTILNDIGPAVHGRFYVFTMDNLNSHRNPAVIAAIHNAGHGVVYRAPYWAVDGAIEYVFNSLLTLIRAKMYVIHTSEDLVASIYEAVQSISTFREYFINVGFVN